MDEEGHEETGFVEGAGTALDQLVDLANGLSQR